MARIAKQFDFSNLNDADKTVLIEMLQEKILLLEEKNTKLEKMLDTAKAKQKKNSKNSHKPPSSDIHPSKSTNKTKKSNKSPGGQVGHKGKNLKMIDNPDHIIRLPVSECNHCGKSLKKIKGSIKCRQEFEIPAPRLIVTEYQSESKACCCGWTTSSCFPEHITHISQYGFRAKSLMVYMNQYQYLPYDRASQFFETIYKHKISPATISNAVRSLSERLTKLDHQIKNILSNASILHCDETGMKVNTKKYWLHTAGTKKIAHFALHNRRGSQATQDIGILPKFQGIMVHDHWKSYFSYKTKHALCNAHHLRELKFINENHNMRWAGKMISLLIKIKENKDKNIKSGKNKFSKFLIIKYNIEYDGILKKAKKEQSLRGTNDSKNLIKRLNNYKREVLRFMNDFNVPFTNNLSEQDLRMAKIKQKISGCFRNLQYGDYFCKIRSLIITARKNSKNIFDIIQMAFNKTISLKQLVAT